MKSYAILAACLITMSSATAIPTPQVSSNFEGVQDGLYVVQPTEAGGHTTHFTSMEEILNGTSLASHNTSPTLNARSSACGPGSAAVEDIQAAQNCLESYFGSTLNFNKGAWTYCIKGAALAFICPNSGGYKYMSDVQATFSSVDIGCGINIMGYNDISGGQGSMTAGRCSATDHFCTKDFTAGS